jgi:sulfur carrier protein ThiS
MKIRVKLFGGLARVVPAYQHNKGLELELPEGSNLADILNVLKIPNPQAATAIAHGRILMPGENLSPNSVINIFHIMYGG